MEPTAIPRTRSDGPGEHGRYRTPQVETLTAGPDGPWRARLEGRLLRGPDRAGAVPSWLDELLPRAACRLPAGCSIGIVLLRAGGLRDCRLVLEARAPEEATAVAHVGACWVEVRPLLEAAGLEVAGGARPRVRDLRHRADLVPRAHALTIGDVRTLPRLRPAPVVALGGARPPAVPAIARVLASRPVPADGLPEPAAALDAVGRVCGSFRLRLHLSPWIPEACELRAIERARHQSGCDPLAASLLTALLDAGRGWRLTAHLAAERPVPSAVRDMLCTALFLAAADDEPSTGPETLDLRGVHPPGFPLPFASGRLLRGLPAPASVREPGGCVVGTTADGSPITLAETDRRRHVLALGATGTGKSTLLARLAVAEVEAGRGLVLLDPHGDLATELLERLPPQRCDDVVFLDFADPERAPVLDPFDLSGIDPVQGRDYVINELIGIFDRLYDMRVVGGPVFEIYFRNAVALLIDAAAEGTTLADMPRVFADDRFREWLVGRCTRPEVVRFWSGIAECTTGDWQLANFAPYIVSKLNQLVDNPLLRPIVGRSGGTIDFAGWLDAGRVVLMRLPKGVIGALDCRLLGMLLLGRLWQTCLARARRPVAERRPFTLMIDEFHSFFTDVFEAMLAEGRKFGLSLVLASQTLGQAGRELRDVLLGNVANLFCFRVGPADAVLLAPWFAPDLDVPDLQRLPDHRAAVRLLARSGGAPVVVRTCPPLPPRLAPEECAALVERSRARWMRPRQD